MKKNIPFYLSFLIAIIAVVAFKPTFPTGRSKFLCIRYKLDFTKTPPCVATICTTTPRANICGIVFADSNCKTSENTCIYRPS